MNPPLRANCVKLVCEASEVFQGRLVSYSEMDSAWEVDYKVGEPVRGKEGSKLFVFEDIASACKFAGRRLDLWQGRFYWAFAEGLVGAGVTGMARPGYSEYYTRFWEDGTVAKREVPEGTMFAETVELLELVSQELIDQVNAR